MKKSKIKKMIIGPNKFDHNDVLVLNLLQEKGDISIGDIAKKTGLSRTACWNRINNLEQKKIIRKTVKLLDQVKVGFPDIVFVSIKTTSHEQEWLHKFSDYVTSLPEVLEFYRLSGNIDYMLKVVVANTKAYDTFYKKLVTHPGITNVTSHFSIEQIKCSTALPLRFENEQLENW